jgi:Protein of unknown function with PCYCGC motif
LAPGILILWTHYIAIGSLREGVLTVRWYVADSRGDIVMASKTKTLTAIAILIFTTAVVAVAFPGAPRQAGASGAQPAKVIPAFHSAPPTARLAATLDPKQFSDVGTQNSYAMAAKIKGVLYQQPCFCYCDANDGHHSLYDCFVTDHAASCNTCRMEGIFAYEETRKGKTAAQIRKEIINDEWKKIDLREYATLKDIR